jgi:hypothetical protein
MNGFDLLRRDKNFVISNNLFSVPCTISNCTDEQKTRCVGNFIGIQNITDERNNTSIAVINDSAEACINYDDVTIGRIKENWTLSFVQGGTDEVISFRVDNVVEDRTVGVYRLKLSLLKRENNNNNNQNQNSNKQQIIRRNGGL